MADVFVDREGAEFRVTWFTGAQAAKTKVFPLRADAEAFAMSKLGKRSGSVTSTLNMSQDQLALHLQRQERLKSLMSSFTAA